MQAAAFSPSAFKRQHSGWFQNPSATRSSSPLTLIIPLPMANSLHSLANNASICLGEPPKGVQLPSPSALQAASFSLTQNPSATHSSGSSPTLIIPLPIGSSLYPLAGGAGIDLKDRQTSTIAVSEHISSSKSLIDFIIRLPPAPPAHHPYYSITHN